MAEATARETTVERERLTWEQFGEASRDLARAILRDGFEPEVVVAIARGGLLPAGAIAYGARREELRSAQRRVLHRHRHGAGRAGSAAARARHRLPRGPSRAAGRRRRRQRAHARARGRSCCATAAPTCGRSPIYTKPGSIATPDYSWRETDLWIDFPWSWQGTVTEDGSAGAERA